LKGTSVAEGNRVSYAGQHGIDSYHLAAARKLQGTHHPFALNAYREVHRTLHGNWIRRLQQEPTNAQVPGESIELEALASRTKFETNGVTQGKPQVLTLIKGFDH
jgi:hypothetical protein